MDEPTISLNIHMQSSPGAEIAVDTKTLRPDLVLRFGTWACVFLTPEQAARTAHALTEALGKRAVERAEQPTAEPAVVS